ncbi:NIPSNAP family protein [Limnoglobus roseus]|uniref:NIPSNAP family protein n=1 Tax=Limnoglobus roseus TaxID=2598579 RepID=A0A5C1AEK6_9BACT|nr:NIPSNAP family protein [Limnoglobus roseus]QEL17180.1 NIPSNAP family protein [Limnoglobus roseus]
MKRLLLALVLGLAAVGPLSAAEKENRLFELRVYYAVKGKLDNVNARFRDHTVKLFEKHGMTNIGYWVPVDSSDERLIYVIAHKDMDARNKSFKDFGADPDWQAAQKASEKDGKIVAKADFFFLNATDYSPAIHAEKKAGDRVFELRTYITPANGVAAINARFRDHTMKLFEKHGMTNVAYWNLADAEKSPCDKLLHAVCPVDGDKCEVEPKTVAKGVSLVYLLSHASQDAAKKSFDTFRTDPDWVKARDASEKAAGGSLTVKDGVKSLFMKATDYSPTK